MNCSTRLHDSGIANTMGGTVRLLRTPMGTFASGFPGFVLGYFTRAVGAGAVTTYARLAAFALGSIVLFAILPRCGQPLSGGLPHIPD